MKRTWVFWRKPSLEIAFLFGLAIVSALPARAATVTWKAAVSGNWSDGTKWSTGAKPADGDTVNINLAGTYSVTVDVAAAPGGLTINPASGTATLVIATGTFAVNGPGTLGSHAELDLVPGGVFGGSGDVTVSGKFLWSGGQIEGAGKLTFAAGSVVDVVTGGQHNLRDRQVVNQTTAANWSSLNADFVGFSAVWENQAGASLNLKDDVQVYYWGGAPATFQNAGILLKSAGGAQGFFDFTINNTGNVSVNSGNLTFRVGGTLGGTWQAGSGATIGHGGGTFATSGSTSLTGVGRYLINSGGIFNVAVGLDTGAFVELGTGGVLQGAADLRLSGKFVWSGGQIEGTGKLTFAAGSAVDVVTGGQHNLRDRQVVNQTTAANWSSLNADFVGFSAVWENQAGASLNLKDDVQVYYWGGAPATFQNAGILLKSAGGAQGFFDFTINNTGNVSVNSGNLTFRVGGTLGGTWQAGSGATIGHGGGTFATSGSTSLTGAGRYLINSGGIFNVAVGLDTGAFVELGTGGVLQGAADLRLSGKFVWSGGQIEGTGKLTFAAGSAVDVVTGGQHNLRDRQVVNQTTAANWSSLNADFVGFSAVWENQAGASLNLKDDVQVYYWGGAPATFQNAGILLKSAGGAQGFLDFTINNTGNVSVNSGNLTFRVGGTLGGTWQAGSGATIGHGGGTFATSGSTSLTGAGRYLINSGGIFNVAVGLDTGAFVELGTGGVLQGAADLRLSGKFVWSGGQIEGTGKLTFAAGSAVDVVTGGQHNLRDRQVVNQTTAANWSSQNADFVGFSAVWENQAGASLNLKDDVQVYYWGGAPATFQNAGILLKSAGGAQGFFDFTINNTGNVSVNSGNLTFRVGGTLGGTWQAGSGATIGHGGGTFATSGSTSLTGAGRYLINSGGIFNVAVGLDTGAFVELGTGGVLQGAADLRLSGKFVWSGGQIEGTGKLTFAAGSAVDVVTGGQHNLRDRQVVNQTTAANWSSLNADFVGFSAVWENQAGASLNLTADVQINYWGGAPATFQNPGTLLKSAGAAQGFFDFVTQNTGNISLNSGELGFRYGLTQTSGKTELIGGNLGGAPALVDIQGGSLEGAGTINTGVSVAGVLKPGNPLGKLQVLQNWNSTNTTTSESTFELGGTNPGVNYDQFFAGGALNLHGELNIELVNGFEPSAADVFELMRGVVRLGTFDSTNSPPGFAADVHYSDTNVTLRLTKTGVPPPQITVPPASLTVNDGQQAVFTVTATGPGLSYQWRKNKVNINGATGTSYTIQSARFPDEGAYTVVVSNAGGSKTSDDATLTVNPTSIDSGLLARYPLDGDLFDAVGNLDGVVTGVTTFVASGARNQAFRFNGTTLISLGASPQTPLVNSAAAFSASFWIRPRTLKEIVPLTLATPDGEFAVYLSAGPTDPLGTHYGFRGHTGPSTRDARATFANKLGCWTHVVVEYKGGLKDAAASYALYVNGELVPPDSAQQITGGAGSNQLGTNIGGINGWLNGDLDEVRIYERALRAQDAVTLSTNPPDCAPEIVVQPTDLTVPFGSPAVLTVQAIGKPPLTYLWQKGGNPFNAPNSPTLQFASAGVDASGVYSVIVTNQFGKATSSNATLSVIIPPPAGLVSLNTGTTEFISGASFRNSQSGWFVTLGGRVYLTGNGGQTWTFSNTGSSTPLNAVQLVGGVGFVAGANGYLGISTNNGATWRSFNTGTSQTFYGMCFHDSQHGFAVGSGGTIYYWDGVTWSSQTSGTTETLYGTWWIGGTAWAVGANGIILRWNGSQWLTVNSGTSQTFYAVAFLNENFGYAVGAGGLICRWNGVSWVPLNSGTSGTFRSVVIIDQNTAYVAGDGGLLCITRDGGNTWSPLDPGTNANLGALTANGGRAYLFGAGGVGFAFSVPQQTVNLPPLIRITSPTNTQQFFACFEIQVEAQASDPDGTISKVEFYRGQFKLAEITTPPLAGRPYRTSFHTDALGFYELRAVATDNRGSSTVSDPVTIEVVPPPEDTAVAEGFDELDGCTVCFMGQLGKDYIFQGTYDLTPPSVWVNISTNKVPEPLLRVTDAEAIHHPYRFYRFQLLP